MAHDLLSIVTAGGRAVPLSVLDVSFLSAGQSSAEALAASTRLAQTADDTGYTRYWVAEHHNMPAVTSTTPPVLIAHLAARTDRITVGSGGVMLANHAPLVVAEQFAMLEALHPGRIDLGIGRAPGADARTTVALRRRPQVPGTDEFPRDLATLLALLGDQRLARAMPALSATPRATSFPQVWLLGSSGYSAQLAGALGLRFAHAAHFAMGGGDALDLYRAAFEPSASRPGPHSLVTASVMVAPTAAEARAQAAPMQHAFRQLRGAGSMEPLLTPADAAKLVPVASQAVPGAPSGVQFVGTADEVLAGLGGLVERTRADEVMVTTVAHDPAVSARSLRLLAEGARTSAALSSAAVPA